MAVAALGHSGDADRVVPVADLEVAALDRTRTQPRKFRRLRPGTLQEILGDRGPEQPGSPRPTDSAPGRGATATGEDDPTDPTDTVSGGVPPLEHPVTGEPPVAPPTDPVAPPQPPTQPPTEPPTGPPTQPPTDPSDPVS